MQRVRIGITGLAVVFLVVLLAAAIVGFHSKDKGTGANGSSATNNSEAAPADPLAELFPIRDSIEPGAEPRPRYRLGLKRSTSDPRL
jgi:hypothetical protein